MLVFFAALLFQNIGKSVCHALPSLLLVDILYQKLVNCVSHSIFICGCDIIRPQTKTRTIL
jgi:hypothetical protein